MNVERLIQKWLELKTVYDEVQQFTGLLPKLQFFFENIIGWNMATSYIMSLITATILIAIPSILLGTIITKAINLIKNL